MNSDQKLREEAPDALDTLIRMVLRESAAGVEPPSRVWERIEERIKTGLIPTSLSAIICLEDNH